MNLTGAAHNEFDVVDFSDTSSPLAKGIAYVQGITERGEAGKPVLVRSWQEYKRYFGGILPVADSYFPLYAFFMLEKRIPLYISPAGHYSDVDDNTTLVGTKATGSITSGVTTPETRAHAIYQVDAIGTDGDYFSIVVNKGGGVNVEIGVYQKAAGQTTPLAVATAIVASINGRTSVTGFSAVTGLTGAFTVSAPVGSGAGANSYVPIDYYTTGTADLSVGAGTFVGGVTAVAANVFATEAESVGTWANAKLTFTVVAAASGTADTFDLKAELTGYPELTANNIVRDFPKNPGVDDIAQANARFKLLQITGVTGDVGAGTVTLSGGARTASAIVAADFIGSATGQTGIYAFDTVKGGRRIAIPEMSDPDVDTALAAYCAARGDIRFHLRAPIGVDGDTAVDYRECSGVYTGTAVDTFMGSLIYGDSEVKHPVTGVTISLPAVCDFLVQSAYRDAKTEPWFAASGPQRGRVKGRGKLGYNLATPARQTEFDNLDAHGLYPLVDNENYGPVFWGFFNLYKGDKLIRQETNAELVVECVRRIKPKVDFQSFEPTDPITWRRLYLTVKPVLDGIVAGRGISEYKYIGDQDVTDINDVVLNNLDDLQEGRYKVKVAIKPIGATKYIGFELSLVNNRVILDNVTILSEEEVGA